MPNRRSGPATTARLRASWLPRGRALADADVTWRHRLVCVLLGLHLPVLLGLALARHRDPTPALLELVPVGGLLALAAVLPARQVRAAAAVLGLLTCSLLLDTRFDGRQGLHAHLFVVVAAVALYQDRVLLLLPLVWVGLEPVLAALVPDAAPGTSSWAWAAARTPFVLAESGVLAVFWRADERSRLHAERSQAALHEGQSSVVARLAETQRVREDLIGTVSHEFRTPLTGIRAAARTLLKHGERLEPARHQELLQAVLDRQARLSRLLENMLTAAQATAADPHAVAEVDAVAAEVAMLAVAARPDTPQVSVVVEPGTLARIDRQALHQVLANLVDNAQLYGSAGSVPVLAGGTDGAGVWLTVSNEGSSIDVAAAHRLFEPFTQADTGVTRSHEGLGMGLYVVRRLVEVYGGQVQVAGDGLWVTVEVRLQTAPGPVGAPGPRC